MDLRGLNVADRFVVEPYRWERHRRANLTVEDLQTFVVTKVARKYLTAERLNGDMRSFMPRKFERETGHCIEGTLLALVGFPSTDDWVADMLHQTNCSKAASEMQALTNSVRAGKLTPAQLGRLIDLLAEIRGKL